MVTADGGKEKRWVRPKKGVRGRKANENSYQVAAKRNWKRALLIWKFVILQSTYPCEVDSI